MVLGNPDREDFEEGLGDNPHSIGWYGKVLRAQFECGEMGLGGEGRDRRKMSKKVHTFLTTAISIMSRLVGLFANTDKAYFIC